MIKPSDIVEHLQRYLPHFTDIFSVPLNVNTVNVSGNVFTVNAPTHGLSVNRKIIVSGGSFENKITSVVDNGDGTLRFGTAQEHDLTQPKQSNDPKTLFLTGIGSPWDGAHEIEAIPNREFFEIVFPSGETVPPDITNAFLLEERDSVFLGDVSVNTVIDTDNFTFVVEGVPDFPTGTIELAAITKNVRITGASDIDRAEKFYTKNATGEAFLFVIMNDADMSKDRRMENDGIGNYAVQNLGKQILLQDFSTVVFFPTDDSTTGFEVQDLAYGEVYRVLVKTLLGFFFDDPDTVQRFVTISTGHVPGIYKTSYYSHVYNWQVPSLITIEDDGFNLQQQVAFMDIFSTWKNNSDPEAILDLNIDLDEEPLLP